MSEMVTAAILVIGNEVLSGRTRDANVAFLGDALNERGIRLYEARVVPDEPEMIVEALNALRRRYDYVFTTGGIGPTHDDITCDAVAAAFDLPVIDNPDARARLEAHYQPGDLTQARLRMARTPKGASLIDNPVSGAPGFRVQNVFVFAGVPRIAEAMFRAIEPELKGGRPMMSRTAAAAVPEGRVAGPLAEVQAAFPDLEIGSYPWFKDGRLGVALVARGQEEDRLDAAAEALEALLAELRSPDGEPDLVP